MGHVYVSAERLGWIEAGFYAGYVNLCKYMGQGT